MNEKEILQYENRLLKAMKEKDAQGLDNLLHDHMLFNSPKGEIFTKSMYIGSYIKREIQIDQWEIRDREISIFTDTALVSFEIHLPVHHKKEPIEMKYRFLWIWQDSGANQYKVIGGSCIPIPQGTGRKIQYTQKKRGPQVSV